MRLLLATAVLAASLLATPAAQAYDLGGKKWPTRTITYYAGDAPKHAEAIRRAVRAWNSSGVNIRFKKTSRRRARLRIYETIGGNGGVATLGWYPRSFVTERYLDGAPLVMRGIPLPCGLRVPRQGRIVCRRGPYVRLHVPDDRREPQTANEMAVTAAHELGHVLGLQHVRKGCAVMHPNGNSKKCPKPPEPWQLRCRLVEADDVRGAIKRYGGKMRPLAPEFCDAAPPARAPTELVASFDSAEGVVQVSWRNPSTRNLSLAEVAVEPGACPASFSDPLAREVRAGRRSTARVSAADSGPHCVAVRAIDQYGRPGVPATTVIDVPEPPSEPGEPPRDGR